MVRRSLTVNEKETVEVKVGLPVGLMRLYQGVSASPGVK